MRNEISFLFPPALLVLTLWHSNLLTCQRLPMAPLVGIKLLHTAVWLFFASCILAVPVTALRRRFTWAAWLSAVVLLECFVLAFNRFRCPLTDVAARYTPDRAANFDIYLPVWLAAHNKTFFGSLFLFGELLLLWQWWRSKR